MLLLCDSENLTSHDSRNLLTAALPPRTTVKVIVDALESISFHLSQKKALSTVTVMLTMMNIITDYLTVVISLLLSWFLTRSLDPKLKEKPIGVCKYILLLFRFNYICIRCNITLYMHVII